MPRRNRNPHPVHKHDCTDRYDVDYVYLPDSPEIAAVVVPQLKTVYRNMDCFPWADSVHEVKNETDKYLNQIRRMY